MVCRDVSYVAVQHEHYYDRIGLGLMVTVRKIITLTGEQDDWIKAQIEAGHYTSDSECIRDLIRRNQRRSAEVEAIRDALHEGENSGQPRAFASESFKLRMLATFG